MVIANQRVIEAAVRDYPMSTTSAAAPPTVGLKLRNAAPRWVYFAIFTISGFSGLIYESIWSHYLKLFLGHAAYAQSLVLMIFMGGLALGSWLAARFSERWRAPVLCYALVEGVIGLIALVFHPLFVAVSDAFFFSILPEIGNPALGSALKWIAAATLIVPQSVLLGMTFPLLSTGILRRFPDHPGGSLAMLYFTNSVGAAVGVLVSGFWLIGLVGLPGTIMTAGLLNVGLALVVWTLVKLDPNPNAPPLQRAAAAGIKEDGGLATLFFFAAGVTGAASFIYEIGWIRMLSLVLGSTTHSFELMLSAFITGLALGGLWIKRHIDRISNPIRFAGWIQVLMGALAVLTIPLYVRTFDWMAAMLAALQRTDSGYNLFTAFSHALALLVMVPTTFLAGMTLPLFTYVLIRGHHGEQAIGRVYASNTLGAICGVLFAVHIGLPLLGLKFLIVLGAGLDILLGLVLLHRATRDARDLRSLWQGAVVGACVLVGVVTTVHLDPRRLSSGVYRYRSAEMSPSTNVVFYKDGKTATIALSASAEPSYDRDQRQAGCEHSNGSAGAGDARRNHDGHGRRPAARLQPGRETNREYRPWVRVDGAYALADPDIEQVDTIEIESAMALAAQGFGERVARTFADPRSKIHLEDAKTFFSLENRTYDAIVAEPSNPWVSGVASLFSHEFYRSVKNYLTPDGLLVQWLQLYEFNDDLLVSVLKALTEEFSDYVVYNTDGNNILIVAKRGGTLGEPRFDRLFRGELGAELERVGLHSDADFLVRKTGSKVLIDSLVANTGVPANSDYFPFLDLRAGKARFREQTADSFRSWSVSPLPLLELLDVSEFDPDRVVPDVTFQRTEIIGRARAIYSSLMSGAESGRVVDDPALTNLRLLRPACDLTRFETNWSTELHTLALTTLAYLDAASASSLLDAVVPAECSQTAPKRLKTWIDLYRAIAARDGPRMTSAAEALLANNAPEEPAKEYYVVVAAMLGNLLENRNDRAIEIWEKRRATLGDLDAAPDLKLILGLALKRHSAMISQAP